MGGWLVVFVNQMKHFNQFDCLWKKSFWSKPQLLPTGGLACLSVMGPDTPGVRGEGLESGYHMEEIAARPTTSKGGKV